MVHTLPRAKCCSAFISIGVLRDLKATLPKVAARRASIDTLECLAHTLTPWHMLQSISLWPPQPPLCRAECKLDRIMLRVIRLKKGNTCTHISYHAHKLQLVVQAWAIVQDDHTVILWIGVQMWDEGAFASNQELLRVIVPLNDVGTQHP